MVIRFHPHAKERMKEHGEQFPAKFKRTGFRRNFAYNNERHGKNIIILNS